MKNNLQGINSRVDEAKNEISNLEYKEVKNTPSEQHKKKKKNPKNQDSVKTLGTISSITTFTSWWCQKDKREHKKLKTYLKK